MSSQDNASAQQVSSQPNQQPIYQPYPQQGYYVPQAAPNSAYPPQQLPPQQQVPYGAPPPQPQGYYVPPQQPYATPVNDPKLQQIEYEKRRYFGFIMLLNIFTLLLLILSFALFILGIVLIIVSAIKNIPVLGTIGVVLLIIGVLLFFIMAAYYGVSLLLFSFFCGDGPYVRYHRKIMLYTVIVVLFPIAIGMFCCCRCNITL